MHRWPGVAARWQIDLEDLGNEHGKPKISLQRLCLVFHGPVRLACNCYGPHSDHQPDLLWTWIFTPVWRALTPGRSSGRSMVRAHLELQAALRSARMHDGGNPRPDLIEKKNTLLALALERSHQWRELSKTILKASAAFFVCAIAAGPISMPTGGQRY